nr:MAG TPA: hypothetical protein [Caudoviricetes sp.]
MKKRKWTDIKALETENVAMRKAGKTRQEIADHLGLSKKQIINWVTRYNKEQAALTMVITPKSKGRPRKDGQPPHQSEAAELKRLRMENQLLRDFLRLAGRGLGQG